MDDNKFIDTPPLNEETLEDSHRRLRVRRKCKSKDIKIKNAAKPLHILITAVLAIVAGFFVIMTRSDPPSDGPTETIHETE